MFGWNKKEAPLKALAGMGGGVGRGGVDPANLPFLANGGTKTGPTGGYYYHVFEVGSSTFQVTQGTGSNIEVLVQASGAAGNYGQPGGGNPSGGGGGGGGTRVHNLGDSILPGDYAVTVGAGGFRPNSAPWQPGPEMRGKDSSFVGNPSSPGNLESGGGNYGSGPPAYIGPGGPSGSVSGWANGSSVFSGAGGAGSGRPGGPNGMQNNPPQPSSLWYYPYIVPGSGDNYGDGGTGGACCQTPFDNGRPGNDGRVVVRYPDSI